MCVSTKVRVFSLTLQKLVFVKFLCGFLRRLCGFCVSRVGFTWVLCVAFLRGFYVGFWKEF